MFWAFTDIDDCGHVPARLAVLCFIGSLMTWQSLERIQLERHSCADFETPLLTPTQATRGAPASSAYAARDRGND